VFSKIDRIVPLRTATVTHKLSVRLLFGLLSVLAMAFPAGAAPAWELKSKTPQETPAEAVEVEETESSEEGDDEESFDDLIEGTEKLEGVFTLYRDAEEGKLYLEIQPDQLSRNYLLAVSLSRGIGESFLIGGLPLHDLLFQFRKQGDRVHFVVPNIRFRTRPGDPVQRSLDESFSDSVLAAFDVLAEHPDRKSLLIDLKPLVLGSLDLTGISSILPFFLGGGYAPNSEISYINEVKAFPENIEIETIVGFFAAEGSWLVQSLADDRAFNLGIHYSIAALPDNDYRPREADERIGYFLTAYRNFADEENSDPFTRYIYRWNLEKLNPDAALSPPKEPIVFWIENTVPIEYREAIAEGVLMWNEAFEQAGFIDAVEVRQMPDDAEWDPEDVRYNTIRWSSSLNSSFFGIGPSRINPLTGEILDADILIDSSVIRYITDGFRGYFGDAIDSVSESPSPLEQLCGQFDSQAARDVPDLPIDLSAYCAGKHYRHLLTLGTIATSLTHPMLPTEAERREYINQYLRWLAVHEVGHTLGLRHNFHGSTLLAPEQLNDRELTRTIGMVGSVMDYVPPNLAPPGVEQGDYFPMRVGPYDEWAIEYGYKPFSPAEEAWQLDEIASRSADPALAYAPDEDMFSGTDPEVNAYDLSADPLEYARWQMENAQLMWQRMEEQFPVTGERYSELRQMFNLVMFYYWRQTDVALGYIGGQGFNRDRVGTGRLPFEPTPADKQRQSLQLLEEYVFSPNAFEFSPEFLNQLAPSRWMHWGERTLIWRLDYPIYDRVVSVQGGILGELLSGERLGRLRDLELRTAPGEALTIPELFETLHASIWTEVRQSRRTPTNISSFRRQLQRQHIELLANMVLRRSSVPEDARTLARYHLDELEGEIARALRDEDDFDTYTVAHLQEARARIQQTLEAQLESN